MGNEDWRIKGPAKVNNYIEAKFHSPHKRKNIGDQSQWITCRILVNSALGRSFREKNLICVSEGSK